MGQQPPAPSFAPANMPPPSFSTAPPRNGDSIHLNSISNMPPPGPPPSGPPTSYAAPPPISNYSHMSQPPMPTQPPLNRPSTPLQPPMSHPPTSINAGQHPSSHFPPPLPPMHQSEYGQPPFSGPPPPPSTVYSGQQAPNMPPQPALTNQAALNQPHMPPVQPPMMGQPQFAGHQSQPPLPGQLTGAPGRYPDPSDPSHAPGYAPRMGMPQSQPLTQPPIKKLDPDQMPSPVSWQKNIKSSSLSSMRHSMHSMKLDPSYWRRSDGKERWVQDERARLRASSCHDRLRGDRPRQCQSSLFTLHHLQCSNDGRHTEDRAPAVCHHTHSFRETRWKRG